MKRGNTGRPDLPESPKIARSSSRDSESDSLSTVSTVWLTSSNSSPSHSQPDEPGASPLQNHDTLQPSHPSEDPRATQSLPANLGDLSNNEPIPGPSGQNWFEPSRTRSISVSDSYNDQRKRQRFQNLMAESKQSLPEPSQAESSKAQLQRTGVSEIESSVHSKKPERHHRISPLCLNESSLCTPGSSGYIQPLRSQSPLQLGGDRRRDEQSMARTVLQGNLHSHSPVQFRTGQTAVRNIPSGMSSVLGNFARDQVRPSPLSVYESSDGSLFTNISSRSALSGILSSASSSPSSSSSRIHISRPDGICLVPRRKSYSESTVISSLGLEGSSARSRGLPGLTGLNSGYQTLTAENRGANPRPAVSQYVNGRGPSPLSMPSVEPDSTLNSSMWRHITGHASGASNATPNASATASSQHSHHTEPSTSSQSLNPDQLPTSLTHYLHHESSQPLHRGQQRVLPPNSNNLTAAPPAAGANSHQRTNASTSQHLRILEVSSASSSPASSSRAQPPPGRRDAQLAPVQPNRSRSHTSGLNERLRLIYHTWSAAALASSDQHDLESPLTSTSLSPLMAVSAANLSFPRGALPNGANLFVNSPPWSGASTEFSGPDEDEMSPGPDRPQSAQKLSSGTSGRSSLPLIKKAGPYILGPRIGSPPVRSVAQCLARKEGTNDFYCIKILTLPEPGKENMDQRQGKMLLLTEFSLLSQLKDTSGVVHCRDFFKDTAWDPNLQQNVHRLCLVVDSLMPHDYDSSSHRLVNLQHHVIQQRRLPEKEALLVFWDIARIVQQLHKMNIVHRDLKLGNMVVDLRSWRVTLANFCLGKHLSSEADRLRDQRGSPAYISPDVLSGKPYHGKPCDMWALGVVLFTMLYGQFPFYDCMPQELFRKIKAAEYTIPNDGRVTEDTKLLIHELLTLDAQQRLTAGQLVDSLEVIIGKWKGMLACETDQVVPDVPVKSAPEFQLDENDKITQTEQSPPAPTPAEKCSAGVTAPSTSTGLRVSALGASGFSEGTSSRVSLGGRPLMIKVSTGTARPMSPAEARAIRHLFTSARGGASGEQRCLPWLGK
ncbi:hypothetical protein EGW08_022876 [Elysia chlorotica]|uniref:Serine/threonine-protein kinase 40 n=1 Tax=Elysia chlorotica TaxID=188477 RepID=A0A3S0Z8P0_ELYCH|nr:hypothetical protein EGW08_022876 [Elysia chlorotica]